MVTASYETGAGFRRGARMVWNGVGPQWLYAHFWGSVIVSLSYILAAFK